MLYYFSYFLWPKALIEPKRLLCVMWMAPFLLFIVAASLFLAINMHNLLGLSCVGVALITLALRIMLPEKSYRLEFEGKELYFVFYWILPYKLFARRDNKRQKAIFNVFEKDGKKLRRLNYEIIIDRYDSSLLKSGFILVRKNYQWIIFGNGYTDGFLLGEKISNYAFIQETAEKKTLHLISEQNIVSEDIESCEKCYDVRIDYGSAIYKIFPDTQGSYCSGAFRKQGDFVLVRCKNERKLLKICPINGVVTVFQIFTKRFDFKKNHRVLYFKEDATKGYVLVCP